MGPQIDFMVESGLMDPEVAAEHPDRNCLTSVLAGDEIARMDCPGDAFQLRDGDMLIACSDGLQFLDGWEIGAVLTEYGHEPSQIIARALLDEIERLNDPDQDNVSIAVVKVSLPEGKVQCLDSARVATRPLTEPASKSVRPRRVNTRVIRMDGSR
jgi:serine/threonine protein phosphatase PrpC